MATQNRKWMLTGLGAAAILAASLYTPHSSLAADVAGAKASPALTGTVSSMEDGAMEGVLVSAKRANSTISITVVTDEKGRYQFPASRLEPGQYAIRVRATGYDLDDPGTIDVGTKSATADLKLHKTANLA